MRSFIAPLVLALAACVAVPAAAPVEGSYLLVEINGQPLPAPSPTEDGVQMLEASLLLMPNGRFAVQARASAEGETGQRHEEYEGTWSIRGDSLALVPDVRGEDPPRFRWRLDEGTLTLYDEEGHEYTFRRSQAGTR